jgi:hypothetical protein
LTKLEATEQLETGERAVRESRVDLAPPIADKGAVGLLQRGNKARRRVDVDATTHRTWRAPESH